jgi:hypothetical protein
MHEAWTASTQSGNQGVVAIKGPATMTQELRISILMRGTFCLIKISINIASIVLTQIHLLVYERARLNSCFWWRTLHSTSAIAYWSFPYAESGVWCAVVRWSSHGATNSVGRHSITAYLHFVHFALANAAFSDVANGGITTNGRHFNQANMWRSQLISVVGTTAE